MRDRTVVLSKELLDQLRDHRSLVMLVLPALLIPFACLLITLQGAGSTDSQFPVFVDSTTYRECGGDDLAVQAALQGSGVEVVDSTSPYSDLKSGEVLAVLRLGDDGRTQVIHNELSQKSIRATAVIESRLQEARIAFHRGMMTEQGLPTTGTEVLEVDVRSLSEYTPGAANGILTLIAPTILVSVIMMAGAGVSADIFAGEKERGTLESLLATQVSRLSLVAGKYAVVAVMTIMVTLITVGGYVFSYFFFPGAMTVLGVPRGFEATNGMMVGIALTSSTFALAAAGLSVVVSMSARSMKEAQLRLSLVSLLPAFVGIAVSVSGGYAAPAYGSALPILNTILALRSLLALTNQLFLVICANLMNMGLAVAALLVAHSTMQREDALGH